MSHIKLLIASGVLFCAGCASTGIAPLQHPVTRVDCFNVDQLVSQTADEPYTIDFHNTRNQAIHLYWINYDGEEELKEIISPNETASQKTFVSHPWVAREESGRCVGGFLSATRVRVDI